MTGDDKNNAQRAPHDRRLLERALRDMNTILEQTSKTELRQMLREMRGTVWQRLAAIDEAPRSPGKRTRH